MNPPPSINADYMINHVRKMYDLFLNKGNFFALMSPDITMKVGVADDKQLPWQGTYKGQDEATKGFFMQMGECVDFHGYEILNAGAGHLHPNTLLCLVSWDATGKKSGGKHGKVHSFHKWTFNKDGLANSFLELADVPTMKNLIGKMDS